MIHNIFVQLPNHSFKSPCSVNEESLKSGTELITTFHAVNEEYNKKIIEPLIALLAQFYQFGADYFKNGELSGDDVAKKLEKELGEIWLENRYHFTGVWPHSANFGELCYSSDPTVDLEITWRYKKCQILKI